MTDAESKECAVIVNESVECYRALGRADSTISELQAEVARLKEALDMETQGKYSAYMLSLADERAKYRHAAIHEPILRSALHRARAALQDSMPRSLDPDEFAPTFAAIDEALGGKT